MTAVNLNNTGDSYGDPPANWNEILTGSSYTVTQQTGWANNTASIYFTSPVNLSSDIVDGNSTQNAWADQSVRGNIISLGGGQVAWDAQAQFAGTTLNLNGELEVADASVAINTTNLGGIGMAFIHSGGAVSVSSNDVGSGVQFNLATDGSLRIGNPGAFAGSIDLQDSSAYAFLNVAAASYRYDGSTMDLFNAYGSKVAQIHVTSTAGLGAFYGPSGGTVIGASVPSGSAGVLGHT